MCVQFRSQISHWVAITLGHQQQPLFINIRHKHSLIAASCAAGAELSCNPVITLSPDLLFHWFHHIQYKHLVSCFLDRKDYNERSDITVVYTNIRSVYLASGGLVSVLDLVFDVSGVKAYSEVSQVHVADWAPTWDGLWPGPGTGPKQSWCHEAEETSCLLW